MSRRLLIATSAIIGIMLISSIMGLSRTVNAKEDRKREKQIVSVQIEEGDTLCSIAKKYKTKEYSNINHYIKEIKETNGLKSNTIHKGCYLIIPYYADIAN